MRSLASRIGVPLRAYLVCTVPCRNGVCRPPSAVLTRVTCDAARRFNYSTGEFRLSRWRTGRTHKRHVSATAWLFYTLYCTQITDSHYLRCTSRRTVPDGPECVHPDIARGEHVKLAIPAQGRGTWLRRVFNSGHVGSVFMCRVQYP